MVRRDIEGSWHLIPGQTSSVGSRLVDLPFCLFEQVGKEMRERERENSAEKYPEPPPFALSFACIFH